MLPDNEIIEKIWCCNMSHVLPTFGYQPYPDRIAVDENSDYSKTIQENKTFQKSVECRFQWFSLFQSYSPFLNIIIHSYQYSVLYVGCHHDQTSAYTEMFLLQTSYSIKCLVFSASIGHHCMRDTHWLDDQLTGFHSIVNQLTWIFICLCNQH